MKNKICSPLVCNIKCKFRRDKNCKFLTFLNQNAQKMISLASKKIGVYSIFTETWFGNIFLQKQQQNKASKEMTEVSSVHSKCKEDAVQFLSEARTS